MGLLQREARTSAPPFLTHGWGACTLARGQGSVIPECLYLHLIQPSKPHDPARPVSVVHPTGSSNKTRMVRKISEAFSVILLMLAVFVGAAQGQKTTTAPIPPQRSAGPAPATAATIDTNEAMFATMCALYASGYESDVSADNWSAYRAQTRQQMLAQKGPAV